MEITTFIAQFMGYFLVLVGGAMLLKRNRVEVGIRNALKNKGTLYVMGGVQIAVGLLFVLAHPSWETMTDKAVSLLSWFVLIEGVFYLVASQKSIRGVIKFIHKESVYYTISLAFVVVGTALVFGM